MKRIIAGKLYSPNSPSVKLIKHCFKVIDFEPRYCSLFLTDKGTYFIYDGLGKLELIDKEMGIYLTNNEFSSNKLLEFKELDEYVYVYKVHEDLYFLYGE